MTDTRFAFLVFVLIAVAGFTASAGAAVTADRGDAVPERRPAVSGMEARAIVENRGQISGEALYYAPGAGVTVYFTDTAVVLDLQRPSAETLAGAASAPSAAAAVSERDAGGAVRLRGCAVWLRFAGAEQAERVAAEGRRTPLLHYFLGADPAAWRSRVPVWSEVVYHGLWPGIELRFQVYGDRLSYRVVAAPGADPARVGFVYAGAEPVARDSGEIAALATSVGALTIVREHSGPLTGEVFWPASSDGPARRGRDVNNPAMLLWSTFLGDAESDKGLGLTLDAAGCPVVTGRTRSVLFPTTPGSYDTLHAGINDVFVAKLDPTGSALLWSTLLGGPYDDAGVTIALDASGNPVVAGIAGTPGFPTTPGAFDESGNGGRDAFVAKFDTTGGNLLWSTCLGGAANDAANRVLIDADGCPVLVGLTGSADFPSTPGAFDPSHNGEFDAFAGRLSPDGSDLLAATFLGGNDYDVGLNLAFAPEGHALITGEAGSPEFPTSSGAYATVLAGETDAFVARLDMTTADLVWSTFVGGAGADAAGSVIIDAAGDLVIAGGTGSADFPTTAGVFDETFNGLHDCFVAKLAGAGDQLLWSSYLGGDDRDKGQALTIDAAGNIIALGYSASTDFPTTPEAFDRTHNGLRDCFVAKLSGSGSDLLGSTFLGSAGFDETYGAALDQDGYLYFIGMASAGDFPTTPGAFDESYGGLTDAFVAKLDLALMGPVAVADPSPVPYLWSSYPNPFNPATTVVFSLPNPGEVSLIVHDLRGKRVRGLFTGLLAAGRHGVRWDGRDDQGRAVAAGIYLVRMQTPETVRVQKLTLVK